MKIVHVETLLAKGQYARSREWHTLRKRLHEAIRAVDWPPGSGAFTIYPDRKGNGVEPIKHGLMRQLESEGWKLEEPLDLATVKKPGKLDAVLYGSRGPVALEWETGNISSSHRALNKMALGLLKQLLACGTLVVPSQELYRFLTDRVGNFSELIPYLEYWRATPYESGVLEIVVIEQDAVSDEVPRIPKGTSGRALR